MGYVIQQVGLFPHQTIATNIATVPQLLGWQKARIEARVDELLELVGLDPADYRGRYPAQLSGGQRQRVGVARALAADPPVLLMDEPFGAIDPVTRVRLQDEFLRLQGEVRKTVVFVTHDIEEAVKMGDRIAILDVGGVLEQYATPAEILGRPASAMVADFVGRDRALKRLRVTPIEVECLEHPPTVAPDATLADAREAITKWDADWVAVVGDDGTLRGYVDQARAVGDGTVGDAPAAGRDLGADRPGSPGRARHDAADARGMGVGARRRPLRGRAHARGGVPDAAPLARTTTRTRRRTPPTTGAHMAMDVADSLLDLVGNTPLVRLGRVGRDLACDLLAKVELFNPGGSVKDRPAVAMIDAAERDGLLQPGGTIVEPTSGNTGVGLAIVAAQRGYRCIFVMSDKMSEEKISLLRAYGAEVVVCPTAVPPEHPDSYYSVADRLDARDARRVPARPVLQPRQPRRARALDRARDLAPDRRAASPTSWPASAPAAPSPASARYLKAQNPDVQIVGADPEGSVYSGGTGRPYLVEGVGEDFWPTTYDPSRRRPHRDGERRRVVRGGAAGHPRGGPAHRRLVRHRGARRAGGRARSSGPTPSSSCCCPTPGATTCRRSSTTTG